MSKEERCETCRWWRKYDSNRRVCMLDVHEFGVIKAYVRRHPCHRSDDYEHAGSGEMGYRYAAGEAKEES